MTDMPPKTHNLGAYSAELVEKGRHYYTKNYKPREMILDKGEGAKIWDLDGNDYIDFGSGIAVCSLGHSDPDLMQAMSEQAGKLWHTSNVFFTEPPILLAEALIQASNFGKRVYFCNSGAEANEAAIKLIRKYAADKGKPPEARNIITFKGSFHGRTLAAVTATAQPKYHEGYEPLPGGFVYCDTFNDEAAIEQLVDENTAAIMLEPVQGEGGVVPAKPGFLKHLRALCDKFDALLVLDEIQAGIGRTGTLFAYEQDDVQPDIVCLAKALGCGMPIGATLLGEKVAETFQIGAHGSTFGGNPVMSAVALAAIKKINQPALLAGVQEKGSWLRGELSKLGDTYGIFADIRGRGLMIGAELIAEYHGKAGAITELARKSGLLVLVAGPNVVRFLPPLNITQSELDEGMKRFESVVKQIKDGALDAA